MVASYASDGPMNIGLSQTTHGGRVHDAVVYEKLLPNILLEKKLHLPPCRLGMMRDGGCLVFCPSFSLHVGEAQRPANGRTTRVVARQRAATSKKSGDFK